MIIALDTNVVLDLLANRKQFSKAAQEIFEQIEAGTHQGLLCATTLTTIDYLLARESSRAIAREQVALLLQLFETAPVTRPVLEAALASKMSDFEDAVLSEAVLRAGADLLVTRNTKDFSKGQIKVVTPTEWLATF